MLQSRQLAANRGQSFRIHRCHDHTGLLCLLRQYRPPGVQNQTLPPGAAPVAVQPAPVAPTPAPAPQPSFMEQQIARALANTRTVGVTTYGAAAALQSGGVEAAEAASGGW